MYDLVIVGAGPAGLTAALYALRSRLNVLLTDKMQPGGYLGVIDNLENYPGFAEGISGRDLTQRIMQQLQKYDLKFQQAEVTNVIAMQDSSWKLQMRNDSVCAKAVIIATGSSPKYLGVPGEQQYLGKGVSYCAVCDAPFFRDKDVVVVGGGNTALEEALYLTRFAKTVTVVHRRDALRADAVLQEKARNNGKIRFVLNSVCTAIEGEQTVQRVKVKNKTKESGEEIIDCRGVFIFVGMEPQTSFVRGLLQVNDSGYIITNNELACFVKGIFACGDCRDVPLRQVITACADGAIAAYSARKYLEKSKG